MPIRSLVFSFLKLVWRLLLDRRVPVFTKVIPLLAAVYLVSPVDFIHDRLLIFGQLDDLVVVAILLLVFVAASPGHVVADQTIGRKLRDLQKQQGEDFGQPGQDDSDGKTVDAKFRYVETEDDDSGDADVKGDGTGSGSSNEGK
jgi:uncharacterized membrane protein YkvA (DUF1232 family)